MNNSNPNMNVPGQNTSVAYNAPQSIQVIVLDDISQAGNYQVNPGGSTIFMNFAMTEMRMRTRDMSGFPLPDRTWSIKETTPQPQPTNIGNFATKEEVSAINDKLDKLIEMMK